VGGTYVVVVDVNGDDDGVLAATDLLDFVVEAWRRVKPTPDAAKATAATMMTGPTVLRRWPTFAEAEVKMIVSEVEDLPPGAGSGGPSNRGRPAGASN